MADRALERRLLARDAERILSRDMDQELLSLIFRPGGEVAIRALAEAEKSKDPEGAVIRAQAFRDLILTIRQWGLSEASNG